MRAYGGGSGPLLQGVLDAMQLLPEPFEPQVEVTPGWAVIWGQMRVSVRDAAGGGVVSLTAPVDRFTPAEWQRRTKRLFDSIYVQLAQRKAHGEPPEVAVTLTPCGTCYAS